MYLDLQKSTTTNIVMFLLLVLMGLFFSFYKIDNLFSLGFDQERDYRAVETIISQRKPTLIGPRAVSENGFHLGPYYYYSLIPFGLIFGSNPVFLGYAAGITSFLTGMYLYYFFTKRGRVTAGLTAAVIWFTALYRIPWNVMYLPLLVIAITDLLCTGLYSRRGLFLLSFLIGLGITIHFEMIMFIPVLFIYIVRFSRPLKSSDGLKNFFVACGGFLLPFSPLILFDVRHGFINSKSLLQYFFTGTIVSVDRLMALSYTFGQLGKEMRLLLPLPLEVNVILLPVLLLFLILRYRKNSRVMTVLFVPLFSIAVISFYNQLIWPEYYLKTAGFSLFLIFILALAENRFTTIVLVAWAILSLVSGVPVLVRDDPHGYNHQRDVMLYILASIKPYNRPNITYDFPIGQGTGFQTLRDYYEVKVGPHNPEVFFVSFVDNPKNNATKRSFGVYAVSRNWHSKS